MRILEEVLDISFIHIVDINQLYQMNLMDFWKYIKKHLTPTHIPLSFTYVWCLYEMKKGRLHGLLHFHGQMLGNKLYSLTAALFYFIFFRESLQSP